MSTWAELDANNVVVRVIKGDNNDPNGDEGYAWILENLGGRWVQTWWSEPNSRKNTAGIGMTYDESRDAFIQVKPHESWILDEETCRWQAPVPYPADGKFYSWDEDTLNWIEIVGE